MDRRQFLRALGVGTTTAAVAALVPELVLDPERALWVPGRTTYFDLGGNEILVTEEWIVREALQILMNDVSFASRVYRHYDDGVDLGPRPSIRMPTPVFVYGA